jgi:adenosylcobyric acid synthase
VLDPDDAALVRGFVVNRMRGDASLFAAGMREIAARTGWEDLGLVPHCDAVARLPAEDAADLHELVRARTGGRVRVAVPLLPGIANFDDLDPLRAEPDIDLVLLPRGTPLPGDCAGVVLPGSKTTVADLAVLREEGWDVDIHAHVRRGGRVLGLCGGYQMLGRRIADPDGIEGQSGEVPGLGLLDVDTVLTGEKRLEPVSGTLDGARFEGYEMHMGRTSGRATARALLGFDDGRADGARSCCGRVAGTYVHGLFGADAARATLLRWFGAEPAARHHESEVEAALDALAEHLEAHMRIDRLLSLAR